MRAKAGKANTLTIKDDGEQSHANLVAQVALSALVANSTMAKTSAKGRFGEVDLLAAVAIMREKVNRIPAVLSASFSGVSFPIQVRGNRMKKSAPKKSAPRAAEVTLVAESSESEGLAMARAVISPSLNAAIAAHSYQKNLMGNDVPIIDLADALRLQSKQVQDGDLSGLEAMLVSQATALQSIFTSLVRRAQVQTQQRHLESFLNIGLKAQAQSRATLQALVELKYPRQPATFVRQANISAGHQQVNNHGASGAAPRTRETQSEKNKLLVEHDDGSTTMDSRAAATASGSHPALEAVESIDRPDQSRRQSEISTKRRQGRRVARAARDD